MKTVRMITRHGVDTGFADRRAAELAEQLPNFVDLAKGRPTALRAVLKLSLDEAGLRCATDPAASWADTWDSFALATQAASAVFVVASRSDGEVGFRLGDEDVRVAATGPSEQNDALTWLTALYLAMVFRDQARINFLVGVPVELLRSAGLDHDDYVYSLVRMWQAYWKGAGDLVELTLAAMRLADPELVVHSTSRSVLHVYFPLIETFYRFVLRDGAKFDQALASALQLYRKFWAEDEESETNPRGFVALGLLALAGHARDMGMSIDVESEYLPLCLLNGNRLGERAL